MPQESFCNVQAVVQMHACHALLPPPEAGVRREEMLQEGCCHAVGRHASPGNARRPPTIGALSCVCSEREGQACKAATFLSHGLGSPVIDVDLAAMPHTYIHYACHYSSFTVRDFPEMID